MKPLEVHYLNLFHIVTKSLRLLSTSSLACQGPELLAKRVVIRKKTSQTLSLLPPAIPNTQMRAVDKMFVEETSQETNAIGIESVIMPQDTGEWLPRKSSCTRQRIDGIISFPFFWSLAKSFLVIQGGFNPLVDCPHLRTAGLKLVLTWTRQPQGGKRPQFLSLLLQTTYLSVCTPVPSPEFGGQSLPSGSLFWNALKPGQDEKNTPLAFLSSLIFTAFLQGTYLLLLAGTGCCSQLLIIILMIL